MATVPINSRKPAPSIEKPLPHYLPAERTTLGVLILNNDKFAEVPQLNVDDFFAPSHRVIFLAMMNLREAHVPVDAMTVTEYLHRERKLDQVEGGAGYISALADGVPHQMNIAHYGRLLREKAQLRNLIHCAAAVQERALAGDWSPEDLQRDFAKALEAAARGGSQGLQALEIEQLITMKMPPVAFVIEPLLKSGGMGEFYGPRGIGKTWITLEAALCTALGEKFFMWDVPKPVPTVYVAGEGEGEEYQSRIVELLKNGHDGRTPARGFFKLIARNLQQHEAPRINTARGRREIAKFLDEGFVLFLDNLTALSPSGDDDETSEWVDIQEWFLELAARHISPVFVNHTGWNEAHSRGTSKREDLLSFVAGLKKPQDYVRGEAMRAQVHIEKTRHHTGDRRLVEDFEVSRCDGQWLIKPLREKQEKEIFKMMADKVNDRDIVQIMGVDRYRVYRLRKKFEKLPPGTQFEI